MEDLPEDVRLFLEKHPCFELTDSKKLKCSLNGHEFPCSLAELQLFTSGKKYEKLRAQQQFDYRQYEPHIVNSTKQPDRLFCKLTLRHINRVPQHVLRHVNGKRFKKAVAQYEECVRQGVEFVPAQLRNKTRRRESQENTDRRVQKKKDDSGVWAPSSSDEDHSDEEDSMEDLYPPSMFTLKKADDEQDMKEDEDDDFQTDDDDDDEEVSEMEVENQMPKRRKVQSAGFTKKFKKNKKKKGFKHVNGK